LFGFLWMRRLPRGSQLKCFTAFVTRFCCDRFQLLSMLY
jgi:hypothetical protein